MSDYNAKSLIERKHSLLQMTKRLKIEAVTTDKNSPRGKELQVEIECNETELATIDHDIELLDKYDNK